MKKGYKGLGAVLIGLALALNTGNLAFAKDIVINIPARELVLEDQGNIIKKYPVAVGTPSTQTPIGNFKVVEKIINPSWTDPNDLKKVIPSGPTNPLGYRWIGIGGNYGIHGTIKPSSIGTYASNGCIRMHERDVEDLYNRIGVGTPVKINYNTMVLEEDKKGAIGFIIYRDGYGKLPVKASTLMKEIAKKYPSIRDFITIEKLQQSIKQAGYGRYQEIIRPLKVRDENGRYTFNAYEYAYVLYVPLAEVARVAKTHYSVENNIMTTEYGSGEVAVFNKRYYIPLTIIPKVFPLFYGFEDNGKSIILESKNQEISQKPVELSYVFNHETGKDELVVKEMDYPMEAHVKKLKGVK